MFVTGHEDGAIRLWNIELETNILLTKDDGKGHKNAVTCISTALHKEIEYLLTSGYDGRVNSWEVSEGSFSKHLFSLYLFWLSYF